MKKLNFLISLSNKIMDAHKELNEYLINGGNSKDLKCERLTNKLRIMIAKEQEVLSVLDNDVIKKYLDTIRKQYQNNIGANRLETRIIYYQYYNTPFCVDAKNIGLDNPNLCDKKFIIAEIIAVAPMFEALKILNTSIYYLSNDGNEKANELINYLKNKLLCDWLGYISTSSFFEAMFLVYNNKIPNFDLENIRNAVKHDYLRKEIFDKCMKDIDVIIAEVFKNLKQFIDIKKWAFKVKYNFDDIYNFLFSLAELEALFPYMSQDLLHELEILFNRPVTIGRFEFEPISTREAIKKALKK